MLTQTKTDFAKKINDMYLSIVKRPADQSGLPHWVNVSANWSDTLLRTEIEKSYNSSEAYFGKILGYYSFCEWSKMDTSQKAKATNDCGKTFTVGWSGSSMHAHTFNPPCDVTVKIVRLETLNILPVFTGSQNSKSLRQQTARNICCLSMVMNLLYEDVNV